MPPHGNRRIAISSDKMEAIARAQDTTEEVHRVLHWLLGMFNNDNMVFFTPDYIAAELDTSVQAVNAALNWLIDHRYVERIDSGGFRVSTDLAFHTDNPPPHLSPVNDYDMSC